LQKREGENQRLGGQVQEMQAAVAGLKQGQAGKKEVEERVHRLEL
jgi:hypothetical protein